MSALPCSYGRKEQQFDFMVTWRIDLSLCVNVILDKLTHNLKVTYLIQQQPFIFVQYNEPSTFSHSHFLHPSENRRMLTYLGKWEPKEEAAMQTKNCDCQSDCGEVIAFQSDSHCLCPPPPSLV